MNRDLVRSNNLEATAILATLHDEMRSLGYPAHDMGIWLTRVLFCLFADDTEIWPRRTFETYIEDNTVEDGHDLGATIAHIFQVLDTPASERMTNLNSELASMIYVNGDLFADPQPRTPTCNQSVRNALLRACRYNWSKVSPAIFGSLFQGVMDPASRRHLGAHYTSETNILRTIGPLFLDDLRRELDAASTRPAVERFHDKIASMTFLDPACGCGNFLVIAYRELRQLELDTLRKLRTVGRRSAQNARQQLELLSLDTLCRVRVDQFFGIEIEPFPAEIARTAMHLADHLANRDISIEFGTTYLRFPIPTSPHITTGNALVSPWGTLAPGDVDFIFGNPPFVGTRLQSATQRNELASTCRDCGAGNGLDYVAAWFLIAARFISGTRTRCAFVATNSITQGPQPSALWPTLARYGMKIDFAHRSFAWVNDAANNAAVHVVIIGFSDASVDTNRMLFEYPDLHAEPMVHLVNHINAYLADAPNVLVQKANTPLADWVPRMISGNIPRDGGYLSKIPGEMAAVIRSRDPIAAKYLRRVYGAREFINDIERWTLWLVDAPPSEIRKSPDIKHLIGSVRKERVGKPGPKGDAQDRPHLWAQILQPTERFIVIPSVSSERRRYIPVGFLNPDDIITNAVFAVQTGDLVVFGILASAAFAEWTDAVSSRMKSDYQISATWVYNTFPWPEPSDKQRAEIAKAATVVLAARRKFPTSSLSDLYDPTVTPMPVLKAHRELDSAVDRALGSRRRFATPVQRTAALMDRYQALTAPPA